MKKSTVAILSILVLSALLGIFSYLGRPPIIKVDLSVIDENVSAVSGARVESSTVIFNADHNGKARIILRNSGPDILLISAKGYVTETVPIGLDNNHKPLEVRLLSNANGSRTVINFGGDVMLGRRYLSSEINGLPALPASTTEGAIAVVKSLSRAFASADLSFANLETIIGSFNQNEAALNKKYLIQSPPAAVAAFKSLGIDLVSMANNHTQDWGDEGIDSTLQALHDAGIAAVGAGDAKSYRSPSILERNGSKIGTLAYTSIKGAGSPTALRFVSEWDPVNAITDIKELKTKADIVIVQLHSGYQYEASPSISMTDQARAAIDAGADIVVSHHPHVTQGMEWYKGHLIVYSLGNLVFDQNLSETFSSGFLRTVWEGSQLVEARYIPIELVDYRPIIVTGSAARTNINQLWEKSLDPIKTVSRNGIVSEVLQTVNVNAKPVQFHYEWGTAKLTSKAPASFSQLIINPGETASLENNGLTPARLGLSQNTAANQLLIGKDLFSWGQFEDVLADATYRGGAQMSLKQPEKQWLTEINTLDRNGYIELTRTSKSKSVMLIRTASRIPLHLQGLSEADPIPTYSIRVKIKTEGSINANMRVDSYWFNDSALLENPESELLDQTRFAIKAASGFWKTLEIPVSFDPSSAKANKEANAILVYFELHPPEKGSSLIAIDDFELIEWRDVSLMSEGYGAYTHVKNLGDSPVDLKFQILDGRN